VENACEQTKLEARNILFWRENPRRPVHAMLGCFVEHKTLFS
jgi:hypothetical protein